MGPMGPMGHGMPPWMGGWGAAATAGIVPLLAVFLLVVVAGLVIGLAIWRGRTEGLLPMRRSPEQVLQERYARGELGWDEFREALLNLLKARYVRGELALEDYEARLEHLLDVRRARTPRATPARPSRPPGGRATAVAARADRRAAARSHNEEGEGHG